MTRRTRPRRTDRSGTTATYRSRSGAVDRPNLFADAAWFAASTLAVLSIAVTITAVAGWLFLP